MTYKRSISRNRVPTFLRLMVASEVDYETGCWNWRLFKDKDGYGKIGVREKDTYTQRCAHRVSYSTFIGIIPTGLQVLHRCDNPGCINPDHLFLGSQLDNIHDMYQKGRQVYNPVMKLSVEQVAEIKSMRGSMSQEKIAQRFGVNQGTISRIFTGSRKGA